MEGQQKQTQKKRRRFPWIRAIAALVVSLLLSAAAILLILSTEHVIAAYWLVVIPIIFTVIGQLIPLYQWLFPISTEANDELPSLRPTPIEVKVSLTPSLAEPATQNEQAKQPITIWNVPYRRNPFFTGREDVLNRLHEHFTRAKTAALAQPLAITGLGGVGKTQIAVEYAYRHKAAYRYILWVNATTLETLVEGFFSIARVLALPAKDEQDQHPAVAAVQHWLAMHDQWLLILDNADDVNLASEFLPTGDSGHILLTTREPAWGSVARSFEVEKMSETEGTLFLLHRAKVLSSSDASPSQASGADQQAAATLVKELGGLPLALDQAGAYIEENKSTLSAYLNIYMSRKADLLRQRGRTSMGYPASVATTWLLAFEQVEQCNPLAADLLRFLAFLAPDAIPEDLIIKGAAELGSQLQALATDETRLDEAVGPLRRFSLVQRNTDQHLLSIHRLVQAVFKAHMTDKTQRKWAERTVRAVNLAFPDVTDVKVQEQYERYVPHALVCATLIKEYSLKYADANRLLIRLYKAIRNSNLPPRSLETVMQSMQELAKRVRYTPSEIRSFLLSPDEAERIVGLANLQWLETVNYKNVVNYFREVLIVIEEPITPFEHYQALKILKNEEIWSRLNRDQQENLRNVVCNYTSNFNTSSEEFPNFKQWVLQHSSKPC